jgi:predicted DNA-binding ribbon-helix-helix protein
MAAPIVNSAPAGARKDVLGGWNAAAAQRPRKRSLAIAGHRTSISLEQPFWDGLRAIAVERGIAVAMLVAAIDAVRGEASLSSAIRLFVYDRLSLQSRIAAPANDRMHEAALDPVSSSYL